MEKIKKNIYPLMMMTTVASFIGYVVENAFKIFMNGYFDNRYMFLPFLLGYGLFTVAIGILLGTPDELLPLKKAPIKIKRPWNYIIYFFIVAILVSLGELALGFAVEKIAGFYYWDYSNLPLNFTRYTSLPTSVGFGIIITLYMGFVYPALMKLFDKHKEKCKFKIVTIVLLSLLIADFIASFAVMIVSGERMLLWRIRLFKK